MCNILITGVGLKANMEELEGISSSPKKYHTFLVEEINQLITDGEIGIFDAVCAETYPEPQPDVATAGKFFHHIQISSLYLKFIVCSLCMPPKFAILNQY